MSGKTKVIAGVVVLAALGSAAVALAVGVNRPAVEVETATVTQEDLQVTVTASGKVESDVRNDVFPQTAGVIASIEVEDGQQVTAGTVLATLETEPLILQVTQAEAALAQAEAQLGALDRQKPTNAELESARRATNAAWRQYQAAAAGIKAAEKQAPTQADRDAASAATQAALDAYQAAKETYEELKAQYDMTPTPALKSSLSQAEVSKSQAYAGYLQAKAAQEKLAAYDPTTTRLQAQAAADQAYAGYLAARAQQLKLETTELSAERRAAQAAVDQAREALVIAQDNLEKAVLRAPIDGTVIFNALGTPAMDGQAPRVATGVAVAPQSAPFTVVDLGALRFTAEIDEADINRIDLGMAARIELDALPNESFESTVTRILPAATLTPTGGTVFPIHIDLSTITADLLIGMRGDATIEVDSMPDAVTIPIEALFDEDGVNYAYVVGEDNVLQRTRIETGVITETRVQVLSGIKPGQTVALSGQVELADGMRIRAKR